MKTQFQPKQASSPLPAEISPWQTGDNAVRITPKQAQAIHALKQHRFFKLICGGSFTETSKVSALTSLYRTAGADCIDIAPDIKVLEAVLQGVELSNTHHTSNISPPLVMVSIPLDPDPHFQKIELVEPNCILCGACVPVCPTEALTLSPKILDIHQPLCYGCSRCAAVCPTEALLLHPFYQEDQMRAVLSHPFVDAVEIHTHHADPYMLPDFLGRFGDLLVGKLISLCFRPADVPESSWLPFLKHLQAYFYERQPDFPLIVQIDGNPMSGTDLPETSLPALVSARHFYASIQKHGSQYDLNGLYITISGGINHHTARFLQTTDYAFIHGIGMGTIARQTVWNDITDPPYGYGKTYSDTGLQKAQAIVRLFKPSLNEARQI